MPGTMPLSIASDLFIDHQPVRDAARTPHNRQDRATAARASAPRAIANET